MHALGRRTSFNLSLSNNPMPKYKGQGKLSQQKGKQGLMRIFENEKNDGECVLTGIKKRTFSLSKLQSVRKSQTAQAILHQKLGDSATAISLKDKVVFEKLNLNSQKFTSYNRHRGDRNQFYQCESSAQIQLSLLKQILRKKQEELILNKQKQPKQQNQSNKLLKQDNLLHYQNNAVKRIKLLKRTKQYEFYDNLVHNMLSNINKSDQKDIFNYNFNESQTTNSNSKNDQQNRQNQLCNFKDSPLKNINSALNKQKMSNTSYTVKFSPTKSSTMNMLANSCSNNYRTFQKKRQSMIFRLSDLTSDNVYEKKISTFIQFIYKVNFSNSIYVDLSLSQQNPKNQEKKTFKVFIGYGNNSSLIKSIVKRRFWLQTTTNKSQSNFVWTQVTQKDLHKKQLQLQTGQLQQSSSQQLQQKRVIYSLKNKFTPPLYTNQSNTKILHSKQVQQADAAYSRSYLGLKSSCPTVSPRLITNHIPNNSIIGSKKILFKLMHWYYSEIEKIDPFVYLPHTYHIVPGDRDNVGIQKFKREQLDKKQRIWIVKPGENTNRGNGISLASTNQIQKLMRDKKFHKNRQLKTYIVQKYLKPFLYNSRKFDLRHYLLITSVNGIIKGYWYNQGYIRTSSQKFNLQELDNEYIHLTNDAIQKNSQNYGKYEQGNKLSYTTFQRYLDNAHPHKKYDLEKQILSQMKKITKDVMKAGFMFLDPERNERLSKGNGCNFQFYGMDFMIDHKFKPYLIEVNANPCLEISCPLLERLIPIAIQHTFRLALDPLMPPNDHYAPSKRYQLSDKILDRLKLQLIFDQKHDGKEIRKKYESCENKFQLNGMALQPEEDMFEDDGEEIKDDKLFDQGRQ